MRQLGEQERNVIESVSIEEDVDIFKYFLHSTWPLGPKQFAMENGFEMIDTL